MTGIIAVKNKGQIIPVEWLNKAIQAYPSAIGVASENEGVIQVLRSNDPAQITVETITGMQEAFKENILTLHLTKTAGQIESEDMQPYVLLENEDKTPALVAFLDGDYTKFRVNNSKFSDAYHCVTDYLAPKILQIAEMCEGDLEKVLAALEKPFNRKDFEAMWSGNKGTLTLVSDLGIAPVSFAVNDLKREFAYGWVSDALLETPLPTSVVTKGKNLASSLAAKVVGQLGPAPVQEAKTDTAAAPAAVDVEQKFWHPPANLHGKPLKAEYRRMMKELHGINELPEKWAERVGIPIPKGKSIKGLDQLPNVRGNLNVAAEAAAAATSKQVSTEFEGILGPKTIEALETDFADKYDYTKTLKDASNTDIPDPETMPAMENKGPTAWAQIGLDMESLFRLKRKDWFDIAKNHPTFSAECNLNLMGLYLNALAKEAPKQPVAAPAAISKKLALAGR